MTRELELEIENKRLRLAMQKAQEDSCHFINRCLTFLPGTATDKEKRHNEAFRKFLRDWEAFDSVLEHPTPSTSGILAVAKAALKRHRFKPGWDLFGLEVPLDKAIEALTQEEINLLEE